MKIYFVLDVDEKMTNFRVAESVVNLCNENNRELSAETVAKMMLLQVGTQKGGE